MKRLPCLFFVLAACGPASSDSADSGPDNPGAATDGAVRGLAVEDSGVADDGGTPTAAGDAEAPSGDGGMGSPPGFDASPPPPDPCVDAGTCPSGTWVPATPPGVNLLDALDCGNFGIESVRVDPHHPSDVYTDAHCQGIWKSTDYGVTWSGPINTGAGGKAVGDSAGGIAIAPGSGDGPPILYFTAIRGSGIGFWRSTDGGVNWTNYPIGPASPSRQDVYEPAVDPYDPNHLLMAGHEQEARS